MTGGFPRPTGPAPSAASPVRHLDARLRVVLALACALLAVWLQRPAVLAAALGWALVLALYVRLPLRRTLARLLLLDAFLLAVLVTLPFSTPGEPLFAVGGLAASREGLERALTVLLKANCVLLVLLALVGTLEAAALGHALHRLRVPARLVQLLLLTERYVELLWREYGRLRLAMRARAFRPRSDRHTWRSLGYLVGMLLVRSLERSQRVLDAMRCRGFDGRFHGMRPSSLGVHDARFLALALPVLATLAAWELER